MALFAYQATDPTGKLLDGQLRAADAAAARRDLSARGLRVVELLWCPSVDEHGNLRDDQIATMSQSLGMAAANRVPLEVTLAVLAEEKDDPRLAALAQRLANLLREGVTIDQAVARLGDDLPPEIGNMLRAGVASGDLAGTVERITRQKMESQRIVRRTWAAIAYPLLILAILVPLMLFLCMWVIPMFADMFDEFDLELPPATEFVLQLSEQLPALLAGMIVIAIGLPLALRLAGGRWLLHRVRGALPLVGRLWTNSGQREFAAMLASFLDLRLPMPQAIEHTGQVLNDRNVARACRRLKSRLEDGDSLSTSLAQSMHFDRSLVAMVSWGERHGVLPEALRLSAELFGDRIEQQSSLLRRMLPPVTLVTVGTLMFIVVVALMVPLVKLIEGLSM